MPNCHQKLVPLYRAYICSMPMLFIWALCSVSLGILGLVAPCILADVEVERDFITESVIPGEPPLAWPASVPESWGKVVVIVELDAPGVRYRLFGGQPLGALSREPDAIEIAAGWPVLAFHGVILQESIANASPNILRKPIWFNIPASFGPLLSPLKHGVSQPRVVPVVPIWPQIAYYCCTYGLITAVLLGVIHTARRWLRKWQKKCVHCGYSNSMATCPECGTTGVGRG